MTEWLTIDTVPKDITVLLAAYHDDGLYWIASGTVHDEAPYWCDFTDDDFAPEYFHKPTHWRPLPVPPKAATP